MIARIGWRGALPAAAAAALLLFVGRATAPAQERRSRSDELRERIRLGSPLTLADYLREEEAGRRRLEERLARLEERIERVEEKLDLVLERLERLGEGR